MRERLPLLGCGFIWPKALQVPKGCIVSTMTHHMKEFMEEHEQGVAAPFTDQQCGMKVNDLKVQRTVRLAFPTGRTVPLSCIRSKDTEFHIRKKNVLVFIEGEQGLHDLQNVPPQVLEKPMLSGISVGHEFNLTTNDGRLGALL